MADKYWIATGAATTANTAGNWNTAANGTGSTGVPSTNDTVIFGHDDTFAANLGTAPCTWDLALTVTRFQTLSNFNAITTNATTDVQFVASSKSIIFTLFDPLALGFKPGMQITISGSTSNNGNEIIASVSNTTIVTVGSLTDEAAGATTTVTYDAYVDLQAHISTTRLDLDCHLKNTSGSNKNINLSGTYPASGTYVFNGVDAQISNANHISYVYDSSANGTTAMLFDNGPYGNVVLGGSSAYYSPASGVPIVNSSPSSFYSLNIASGTFFQPDPSTASPRNDSKKQFIIETTSAFTMACNKFDAGLSTFEFVLDGSSFEFPVTGSATYGATDNTFIANWCHIIISSATGGRKATIPSDRTLSVNSLLVGTDAVLEGHKTADSHVASTIISISRPQIEGAWNFSQMGDGIYVSLLNDAYPITPSDGPVGRVQLSNDGGTFTSDAGLTFASNALHADQGIKLTEIADHPVAAAAGTGIIWVKNTTPSTLIFTDDAGTDTTLGSGGGGGITALTGNVTASGSGSVAATIADEAVTYAKMQHVSATSRVLGRITSGAGDVEELTGANIRTIANVADGATAYTDGDAIGAVTPLINNNTTLINANTAAIAGVTVKASKCFVYLSGNQSYTSGATKIGHDTALWNVGSNYDTTNEYYVAPRDGYYLVACSYYASATPTWAMSLIYVDTGSGFAIRIRRPSVNGQDNMISAVIKLDAGDKVAHYAHASGSTTIQSALNTLTYFQVTEML